MGFNLFFGHITINTSCWKRYEGIYIFYPVDIPLNLIGVINQYVLLDQSPLQRGYNSFLRCILALYSVLQKASLHLKVNAVLACSGTLD